VAEFHYLHHAPDGAPYADPAEMAARIAAAAGETGIGLTLLPVLYSAAAATTARSGRVSGASAATTISMRGCSRAPAPRSPLGPDARLGVAPHSLRAVSAEALGRAANRWRPAGRSISMSPSSRRRWRRSRRRPARGRSNWLLANAPVDARWCLIHATHMTPAETEAMAQSGAVAGLCPITEANLGDGIFDAPRFLAAGGRFGIGSDSNVRIALSEELRTLEYGQRLRDGARAVLADAERSTGRLLLEMAASAGAQATGRDAGALAPGRLADLAALDGDTTALLGLEGDTLLDAFVFAGDDGLVSDVWSAGRHVVRGGRHIARDRVERRFRETLSALRASL
jgi:formimidoylglutamate deiminase